MGYKKPSPVRDQIKLLLQNPDNSCVAIARQLCCSEDYVVQVAGEQGLTKGVRKQQRIEKREREREVRALLRKQERQFYVAYEEELRAYDQAKYRCINPDAQGYKDWGGRGIKFLYTSKRQFISDVGSKPSYERTPGDKPLYTLDRKNNNGNYEPGNCRWATYSQQAQNTRRSRFPSSWSSGWPSGMSLEEKQADMRRRWSSGKPGHQSVRTLNYKL